MASRTTTDPIEILLEMGVDLDNLSEEEDYLSALMEAIATIEFKTKGKGDARSAALREEVIKIRKGKRKPQAKKTKISADSFRKGTATETAPQSVGQKALPPAIKPKTSIIPYQKPDEVDDEEEGGKKKKARTRKKKDKDQNLLEGIAKSVSNIANILKDQYGLKKKKASYDRKKAEADKRKLKESNLEKSFKGLSSAAEKVIAPVKSALDGILDFFLNIIIGRFLVKFIGWFGDPKNKEKVDSVVRFLVDHGPKLLAAFLLFGTSIGRFAVRLSAVLLKGALRLGAAAAKFALRFAMANPAAAAITAIVGGAALGAVSQANTQSNDPDAPEGRTQLEDTMDFGGVTGDPMAGAFRHGGVIPYYNDGGGVSSGKITTNSGSDITGAGPDTQLIAAQPGEIVINKKTVDAVGSEHFLGLNQQYGGPGANKPKTATVQTASDGGFVLPAFSAGGYVSGTDTGKRGTPDPEKEESSGSASPSLGYRLGQVNPMVDLRVMENVDEKVYDRQRRRGQGGRLVGSTTQRAGEGTKIYKNGQLVTSYDKYGRKKEYEKPEGFMRALAGSGDLLTGNLFDFDRRNEKNVGISESRIVTKDFKGGREFTDDTTTSRLMTAIARSDLIEHQDQILRQLPRGNTIENVISGDIFRGVGQGGRELGSTTRRGGGIITPEKLATILATSDAQKATRRKQDRARRLDLAIRGIGEKDGVSMMVGDMTPALQQAEATANKRHAELMKSTNPERIAAYDKQHGQGAYSQKLKEKLYKTYGGQATGQTQPSAPTPTGKVVGRENMSPQAQAAIARLEAKKGLPPDMQYTRNGKKISAEQFNRVRSGNIMPGGGKPGGFLGGMMEGAKNMLGGMFKPGETKTIFRDGNIGTPTAEEQKAIDKLNANRARADKREAESKSMMNRPKKSVKDDPLFAEYQKAYDDPKHPLHAKVAGDLFDDTGTKDPLRFEDFKKLKAQQSQAKLSPNQPSPAAPPAPPAGGGSNVKVVRMPSPGGTDNPNDKNTGGSDVNAASTGNGNKAKWNILGIPMPF